MSNLSVCVLIAEDEVLIADLVEATLGDEGLAATVTYSGSAAMAALETSPTGFQVLVTDIRVGAPDGWAVAHAARKLNPAIGVIYMTGDSMRDWTDNGVPGSLLISKPFVPAQIVTAVMTLLARTAVPPRASGADRQLPPEFDGKGRNDPPRRPGASRPVPHQGR